MSFQVLEFQLIVGTIFLKEFLDFETSWYPIPDFNANTRKGLTLNLNAGYRLPPRFFFSLRKNQLLLIPIRPG